MVFELEGEPARVLKAGEAFWEPGGDVIHYQDGNNRDDIPLRFTVAMLCAPGGQMTTFVDDDELMQRKDRRAPDKLTAGLSSGPRPDSSYRLRLCQKDRAHLYQDDHVRTGA